MKQQQIPQGYKLTEVGIIPEDWEIKILGDVGSPIIGLTYSPKDISDLGILVLRSSNIKDNTLVFTDNVFVKMNLPDRVIVRKDDILICVRNGSRQLIGKCALITKKAEGMAFGAFMSVFRSKYNKFIFYLFQSDQIQRQINESMGATINQITNKDLISFKISFPTEKEQIIIANALSDIDTLINQLKKLIAKKQAIKTATMQQLLTGKTRLPAFAYREDGSLKGTKQSELGEIPEDWELNILGDIAKLEMGQSPKSEYYNNKAIGLPLIQGNADIFDRKTIIRNYTSVVTKKAYKLDIILSVRAPVGEVAIATVDCCIGRGVCAIKYPNNYLYHWLVLFEPQWEKFSKGSTFDSINSEELKSINIVLPNSHEEQIAISNLLSDMDKEITTLEQRLAKTELIKQGMMQELLTGKTRLI